MCIEMKNMKYTSEVLGILRKENMELIKCLTRVGKSVHGFPERIPLMLRHGETQYDVLYCLLEYHVQG